jgi:hypothetical protein
MKGAGAERRRAGPVTWERVRELALGLSEVEEGTSYGTPALRVRGKLFVRFHQGGDSLVVRIGGDERATRMTADPEAFYLTDHYAGSPWMLVRLSAVHPDDLSDLLEGAWRLAAPRRVVAAHDAG